MKVRTTSAMTNAKIAASSHSRSPRLGMMPGFGLAAQAGALDRDGDEAVIATTNVRHLGFSQRPASGATSAEQGFIAA